MALDRIVPRPRLGLVRRKPDAITIADRARDAGQWELAAQLYRKALDRDPRNPPIWVQYGHALKESGELRDFDKLAQAELAYRRALLLDPTAADPHLQLGHVLKLQGKTEEAQAAYLRAFALDPSVPHPLHELSGLGWSEAQVVEFRRLAGAADVERGPSTYPRQTPPERSSTLSTPPESSSKNPALAWRLPHDAQDLLAEFRGAAACPAIVHPYPTFSVIIPVHSRTWELREALDSVLAQSFSDLEVIIVTNASPPETIAFINKYVHDDPRIRAFFYSDDSGNACRGRNRGVIEARGEFISFLDSDDLYFPETLATALQIFREHEVDFVAGRASWIVDGSRIVGDLVTGATNQACPVNMAVLMRSNPFMTCTVHVRRDLILKHGGFRPEQKYLEDLELWLRLAKKGCRFYYSEEIFSKYRLHAGNTELKYIDRRDYWFQQMRINYLKPFTDWGI